MSGSNNKTKSRYGVVDYRKTVASSASATSAEIDLEGQTLVGIIIPAVLAGGSVSCTFTVATASGGTFRTLKDKGGSAFTVTIAVNNHIYLDPSIFSGVRFMKIVTNASETITITLATRPVS